MTSLTGRSDTERQAAVAMQRILTMTHAMSVRDCATYVAHQNADFTATNRILFATLALNVTGKARDLVKQHHHDGVTAWLRIRERLGGTIGASAISEVFGFNWKQMASLEEV